MKKPHLLLLLLGIGMVANSLAAPPQVSLDVTVIGDGKVTSDLAGIDCRAGTGSCTENFKKGTTVVLTAAADPDSNFVMWGGACAGTQPICTLKLMAKITNVTATFDTATVTYPAPVLQTGQTLCVDDIDPIDCTNTGQDGDLQLGVALPTPRFYDNGDGTVIDNATGLRWLKDAGCLGNNYTFTAQFDVIVSLNAGTDLSCTDYQPGTFNDWRVPNIRELHSLINYNYLQPPISNAQGDAQWSDGDPFVNLPVSPDFFTTYWIRSSTPVSHPDPGNSAFGIDTTEGVVEVLGGGSTVFVWAVRSP